MKSIQSIQDKFVKNIQHDKSAVISRAVDLSDATHPLLISYLVHLRKINAIHNKIDVKNETAQMIQAHNYLCEHNLFYFLTVTGQVNLLRELFQNNEKLAASIAVAKEIEYEQEQAKAQNYLQTYEASQKILNKKSPASMTQSVPVVQPDLTGLSNFLMYQYYDSLHKQITNTHHVAQIAIYTTAHTGRLARLNSMVPIILNNSVLSSADKKMFLDMRREYHTQHQQIMGMSVTNKDGSSNFQAAEQQYSLLKKLDEDMNQRFESYLDKLINKPGLPPALKTVFQEQLDLERLETSSFKAQLEKNEQKYQVDIKDISVQRDALQSGASSLIENIINDINFVSMDAIPKEQQDKFIQAFTELDRLNDQLKQATSPMEQIELMTQCADRLDVINPIIQPLMDKGLNSTFTNNLNVLHQVINEVTVSKGYVPVTLTHVEVKAKITLDTPNSFFSPKSQLPINEENLTPTPMISEQSSSENIAVQRKIKLTLQEEKLSQYSPQIIDKVFESYNEIDAAIQKLMLFEEFSEEDIELYEQFINLGGELKKSKDLKDSPMQLVSKISDLVVQLSQSHESIAEAKNNLNEITQKINLPNENMEEQSFHI